MKNTFYFVIVFIVTLLSSCFLHELGHAVAGWVQGIAVVPTPLKEYVLQNQIEWRQEIWISLGGVLATVLITLGVFIWYKFTEWRLSDAVLAGILLMPCAYTILFLLYGRGHDALEWQAAQTAIGAEPSGHLLDWMMAGLLIAGIVTWVIRRNRRIGIMSIVKSIGLLFAGFMLLIYLQGLNNALFDRFFPNTETIGVPPTLQPDSNWSSTPLEQHNPILPTAYRAGSFMNREMWRKKGKRAWVSKGLIFGDGNVPQIRGQGGKAYH